MNRNSYCTPQWVPVGRADLGVLIWYYASRRSLPRLEFVYSGMDGCRSESTYCGPSGLYVQTPGTGFARADFQAKKSRQGRCATNCTIHLLEMVSVSPSFCTGMPKGRVRPLDWKRMYIQAIAAVGFSPTSHGADSGSKSQELEQPKRFRLGRKL